jgi:hypothetical protein
MWVWKERFQADFGRRPVPGMKELYDHRLKRLADTALVAGIGSVTLGAATGSRAAVALGAWVALGGVVGFLANFVRMARWELFDLEFEPTEADWEKFRFMFEGRGGAEGSPAPRQPD